MRVVFVLIFLYTLAPLAHGQSYYFRNYQVEDGLTYNSVISSLQDKNGFLWFGTKDGLNRFDGYTFKTFRLNEEDKNSIGSNYIFALAEDSMGNLWVATSNGLYSYSFESETFNLLPGTEGQTVSNLSVDKTANVWFIKNQTLIRLNVKTGKQISFDGELELPTSLSITEKQEVWVSSGAGYIARFLGDGKGFDRFDMFSHSAPALTRWIPVIQAAGEDTILVGTQGQGLKVFSMRSRGYTDVLSYNKDQTPIYVRDILHNTGQEYWLATESGIFIYDLNAGLKQHLRKDRNDPFSLSDNAIYTLTKDQEGGIWAGTYFGGVNYYTEENSFFEKIFSRGHENLLKNNAVREIVPDSFGNLWIGTEDAGLVKFNPTTNAFLSFQADGRAGSISHNNIHGLVAWGRELWVGTFENGLDILDIPTGKVLKTFKTENSSLGSNFIEALHLTKDGNLYLGSSSGLFKFNPDNNDFIKITKVPSVHLHSIKEDEKGVLWIAASNNGVLAYDPVSDNLEQFSQEAGSQFGPLSNYVNDLSFDHQGNLWVSTENGLSMFNPNTKRFTHPSAENSFSSNVFYKVIEDEQKGIWVSTARGLLYKEANKDLWKLFTKNNGLLNDQFNYKSGFKAPDGTLYFGSVKGLIRFNPKSIPTVNQKPKVFFTGFQVSNKELSIGEKGSPLEQSILITRKITLAPNQSSFSIDFAALNFAAPHRTQYAYRMKGVEDDWVFLESNRKVYFTGISSGNYLFEVKASLDGNWGEEVQSLAIELKPPFWASSFAFVLYFVLACAGGLAIHRFNMNRLKERNQRRFSLFETRKEREIYRAKLQFFTNITHEIRTPLTLIKGPLESLLLKLDSNTEVFRSLVIMKRNTDRLIQLTDQLLNFRKAEAENLSLSFVKTNVSELLEKVYNRFLPLAQSKGFQFDLVLPEEEVVAYVDREAVQKILSNLFSNGIKYSSGTILIRLVWEEEGKDFEIVVSSSGEVIPLEFKEKIFEPFFRMPEIESQSGTGIGLALSRSLAELHKGTLCLTGEEEKANVFKLSLPVFQDRAYQEIQEPKNSEEWSHPVQVENIAKEEYFESLKANQKESDEPSVLIVDDNSEILSFVSQVLSGSYRVFQASGAAEAFAVLQEETISLIISDVMMPDVDGYELCKKLKENLEYCHIPLVLLSAKGSLDSKLDGLEAGADIYIEKPFSPSFLTAQVESLLTNREKIREYFSRSPLAHIKSMAHSAADSHFLESLQQVIDKHLDNTSFDVEQLAWLMNMSRPTLYRKIKGICEMSPLELITVSRLKKAAQLLVESDYTIKKIAQEVGFSSQTQFSRNFMKQFNISPSQYRNSKVASTESIESS